MLANHIESFSEEEGAEHAEVIPWRIGWGHAADFTTVYHMQIRHVVYFNHRIIASSPGVFGGVEWDYSTLGVTLREWLRENAQGEYSIQDTHVFFEDHDDALMCYLRYKG